MKKGERIKSKQFGEIDISEVFSSIKEMVSKGYNLELNDTNTKLQINYKTLPNSEERVFAAALPQTNKGKFSQFLHWVSRNYNRILITILALFAMCVLFKNVSILSHIVSKGNISGDAIAAAYQGTLLSNGLTIIAIAIAIWAGLSITNAVARKDVLLLQRKTERLHDAEQKIKNDLQSAKNDLETTKDGTKEVQASAENLRGDITNLTQQQSSLATAFLSAFKSELLKTKSDVATLKIYKDFELIDFDSSDTSHLLRKMIIVEQLFAFVYANHTSHQKYGEEIISQADIAIKEIAQLQNDSVFTTNLGLTTYMIARYLEYRHAELLFYKGYALTGEEKKKSYETAIALYKKSWWLITASKKSLTTPPIDTSSLELCVTSQDDEETVELKLYLLDTILESYNKWATALVAEKKPRDVEKLNKECDPIVKECKNAISFLEEKAPLRLSEVYYRNLGCYYSTVNKAIADTYGEDEILVLFEKAFRLAIDDDNHVLPYRVDNIYYVLVQHLYGMIKRRLVLSDTAGLQLKEYAAGFNDVHMIQRKLHRILCSARKDLPRRRIYYSVHGLLCALIAAEKKVSDNTSPFEEDVNFYLAQAKADYDFLIYTFSNTKEDYYTETLGKQLEILKNL